MLRSYKLPMSYCSYELFFLIKGKVMRDVRMGVILVGNSRNVAPSEGCS